MNIQYSYEDSVSFLAELNSNEVFLNKGPENAIIVLKNIFKYSNDEVLMFSGNKKGDVTNDEKYNKSIADFLESGKKLKLILENKKELTDLNFKVYQTIYAYQLKNKDQVAIKFANEEFINQVQQLFNNNLFHFIVGDKRSFRLEVRIDDYKAICSFNHPFAKTLADFFDKYFPTLN